MKSSSNCKQCGKEISFDTHQQTGKYCNNRCQAEYRYQQKIEGWKTGNECPVESNGTVKGFIKRYLREKFDDRCVLCGWHKINPVTGKVPVVADHIDGNWQNNKEENLRLLCPCCDSLQPTYCALNMGNGRKQRKSSL